MKSSRTLTDFQRSVATWMDDCFQDDWRTDSRERTFRFLEEAVELAQASNCSKEEARAIVEYVYSRPTGSVDDEVGGVLVTVAGLAESRGLSINELGCRALEKNYRKIEKIRAKRARGRGVTPRP